MSKKERNKPSKNRCQEQKWTSWMSRLDIQPSSAPAETGVYDAFTTPKDLDGWFTNGASIDPRASGYTWFRWKDWGPDKVTTEEKCPVLEAKRPERFVSQWHTDHPSYATTIELDFTPAEGGTVVRLREHGYHNTPSGRKAMIGCATGWGEALTLLKFYIEHGIRY